MESNQIRKTFLDFFNRHDHRIIPSAPMVIKDDPTLMFTNAGMNQFKDLFLGNKKPEFSRIADTQKCLRVSGKHNDLEEVGVDTYHHTMFEMLGNWSFGDYFKKEAIGLAWKLLVDVYGIAADRLYITVFGGDEPDSLPPDHESAKIWAAAMEKDKILLFGKKDNFWEMGDTGPCGPCSEIHIDLRDDKERQRVDGRTLVNKSHPQLIELWNLVFIEFNRLANGNLVPLPAKHVDTGMGFERLCMVLQGKKSTYETDVFQEIIREVEKISAKKYNESAEVAVAMRVIADHLRAIAFSIADGQLPFRDGAGYVIRRILRRAVRYGYSFLALDSPFIYKLVPVLSAQLSTQFPELKSQETTIGKVIFEEEESFLRTLEKGIKKLKDIDGNIEGSFAFELYDTYGFPIDLTQLIACEKGLDVDMEGFQNEMEAQKTRARQASIVDAEDWTVIREGSGDVFIGYNCLEADVLLLRYRKVKSKGKEFCQMVFDKTPFYAESGGQVGDKGIVEFKGGQVEIFDTKKENNLILHFSNRLPSAISKTFHAKVDMEKRMRTANNHSATHLLHAALRRVLGNHVEQRGSFVHPDYLRFDFSHYSRVSEEELAKIEDMVNAKIIENIPGKTKEMSLEEAKKSGAMALFGEKYGDRVRVVVFDEKYSIELCGGTHVNSTAEIKALKIVSESSVAAGVRRIEAVTAETAILKRSDQKKKLDVFFDTVGKLRKLAVKAEEVMTAVDTSRPSSVEKGIRQLEIIHADIGMLGIYGQIKNRRDLLSVSENPVEVENAIHEIPELANNAGKSLEKLRKKQLLFVKEKLLGKVVAVNGINSIIERVNTDSASMKEIAYLMKDEIENMFLVLGGECNGKALLCVFISENLIAEKNLNAVNIIRDISSEIQGGGGGQPFYATAGGNKVSGINSALEKAKDHLK